MLFKQQTLLFKYSYQTPPIFSTRLELIVGEGMGSGVSFIQSNHVHFTTKRKKKNFPLSHDWPHTLQCTILNLHSRDKKRQLSFTSPFISISHILSHPHKKKKKKKLLFFLSLLPQDRSKLHHSEGLFEICLFG